MSSGVGERADSADRAPGNPKEPLIYLEHFRLEEHPFRLTPDQDFFYLGGGHARAKAYLDYTVVSRDGFVVITGEIGAGKTTLLNRLMAEMPDDVILAHINQSQLNDVEFLQAVVSAFGMDIANAGKVELLNRLRDFLRKQAAADHPVVLAVDEAQSLGYTVLEEIRQLAGIESDKSKLLSVILMGQPELDELISSPELEQLAQRIRLRFHLGPLTREEVREYILHRLRVAKAPSAKQIFSEATYDIIYQYAGGIPRLINSLCDMAMLAAFVDDEPRVTPACVTEAVRELGWPPFEERQTARRRMGAKPADKSPAPAPPPAPRDEVLPQVLSAAVTELTLQLDGIRSDLQAIERRLGALSRDREKN